MRDRLAAIYLSFTLLLVGLGILTAMALTQAAASATWCGTLCEVKGDKVTDNGTCKHVGRTAPH